MNEAYPPRTMMTAQEGSRFLMLLRALPSNTGWLLSHIIEPPHSPPVVGGFSAKVILPGVGGVGNAYGNTPYEALRDAWMLSCLDSANRLAGKCVACGGPLEFDDMGNTKPKHTSDCDVQNVVAL